MKVTALQLKMEPYIEEIGDHSAACSLVITDSHRNAMGAAKGKRLIAKAVCVKDGRTTVHYRVDVMDELGNLTATVTTMGYHVG